MKGAVKMLNQDLLQIIQTVIYAIVAGIFGIAVKRVKPVVDNKIKGQKNSQILQYEQMALGWAKNVVVPLAVNSALGTAEKRQIAVQKLSNKLDSMGIDFQESKVTALVERAYQAYKANGGQVNYLTDHIDANQAQQVEDDAQKADNDDNQSNDQPQTQSEPVNPYANQDTGSDNNA